MIPLGVIAAARTAAGSGHRYWRWVSFTIPGAYFEVGELRVLNGSTRLSATMSTGTTPSTGAGTEANLADDNLDTRAYWTQADAQAGGFWVMADLGTAQVVTGMQIGAFDTTDRFPSAVTLQWSDNASDWTTFGSWSGMTYPGNKTWGPVLTPAGGGSGHRYWRWTGFAWSDDRVEISELRVVNGSTPIAADMTSSSPPSYYGLYYLTDNSFGSGCTWWSPDGLWIVADLGSAQEVTGMQIGAVDTPGRYPTDITLQYADSDAGPWTTFGVWSGLTYPGNYTAGPVLTP